MARGTQQYITFYYSTMGHNPLQCIHHGVVRPTHCACLGSVVNVYYDLSLPHTPQAHTLTPQHQHHPPLILTAGLFARPPTRADPPLECLETPPQPHLPTGFVATAAKWFDCLNFL